ncbi:MAG: hypothetical protein ACRDRT_18100, partial [Pseudonocardiaceae bacterium]
MFLQFTNGRRGWLAPLSGDDGTTIEQLFQTDDGGAHWAREHIPTTFGGDLLVSNLLGFSRAGTGYGYAGALNTIFAGNYSQFSHFPQINPGGKDQGWRHVSVPVPAVLAKLPAQ